MTPVTVDTSAVNAGGSGNTGWSAKSLFGSRSAGTYLSMPMATSATNLGNAAATTAQGQSFTTLGAVTVTAIAVRLKKVLAPTDNVTIKLTTNGASIPTGTVLGTSDAIAGTVISTSVDWVIFPFSTPVALSASTKYWLTIQRSGANDASNYYTVDRVAADRYAGGGQSTLASGSWSTETAFADLGFVISGTVTPSGAFYQITQDSALHAWKSTDDGATWTEQDSAHAPSVVNSAYTWSADDSTAGEIAVAYFSNTNTVRARVFDTISNTWASTDLSGADATTDADNVSPIRISHTPGLNTTIAFTSIADTADISLTARTSPTAWTTTASFLSGTSAERSIVSDMVSDNAIPRFDQVFFYDAANDDFTLRSRNYTASGTAVDLDATIATTEAGHASAVFQPYDNGSGVEKIIAAYIDANNTLQERTAQLGVTSASVTLGTQHQVTATTSYAGRHVATCKYGADLYVFASTATTIVYYKDTGASGTWGTAQTVATGLTSAALSTALPVPGVGILISYTSGGNVVIDWAVDGPSAPVGASLAGTLAGDSSADADRLRLNHALSGALAGDSAATAAKLTEPHALAGSLAGDSSTSADLTPGGTAASLAGSLAGSSTATAAALRLDHALSGQLDGDSTATATTLRLDHELAGAIAGESSATAAGLRLNHPLAATAAGDSSATADLTTTPSGASLAGSLTGSSAASGAALRLNHPLGGDLTGDAIATAAMLRLSHALMGQLDGSSTADASQLRLDHALAGMLAGDSEATGNLTVVLAGPDGILTATLTHEPALTALLTAQSALGASLSHQPALSATLTHARVLTATLTHEPVLTARLETE